MSDMKFYTGGLDFMEDLMQRYQVTDEKALSAIETGAKMLADDVRKLPKPRSKMTGSGYTHLLWTAM